MFEEKKIFINEKQTFVPFLSVESTPPTNTSAIANLTRYIPNNKETKTKIKIK